MRGKPLDHTSLAARVKLEVAARSYRAFLDRMRCGPPDLGRKD